MVELGERQRGFKLKGPRGLLVGNADGGAVSVFGGAGIGRIAPE